MEPEPDEQPNALAATGTAFTLGYVGILVAVIAVMTLAGIWLAGHYIDALQRRKGEAAVAAMVEGVAGVAERLRGDLSLIRAARRLYPDMITQDLIRIAREAQPGVLFGGAISATELEKPGPLPVPWSTMGLEDVVRQTAVADQAIVLMPPRLLRDGGVLRMPVQPVLYGGVRLPVTRQQKVAGLETGIVVLGIDLRPVFETMRSTVASAVADDPLLYVVDAEGHYLVHPLLSNAYQGEFGEAPAFPVEFPALARKLLAGAGNAPPVALSVVLEGEEGSHRGAWIAARPLLLEGQRSQEIGWAVAVVPQPGFDPALVPGVLLVACALLMLGWSGTLWLRRQISGTETQVTRLADILRRMRSQPEGTPLDQDKDFMALVTRTDAVGEVARVVREDMTDLQALGRSNFDLRAELTVILETVQDAVVVTDSKGTILLFNSAAERQFGCAASDAIGRDVGMLMPTSLAEQHHAYMARYLESGVGSLVGSTRELQGRRSDGSLFPIHLTLNRFEAHGQPRFCGAVRDLSRRRAYESQVARLDFLAGYGREELLVFDGVEMVLSFASPAFSAAIGRPLSEVTGRPLTSVLIGTSNADLVQALAPLVQGQATQVSLPCQLPRPETGGPASVFLEISCLGEGNVRSFVAVVRR